jgi:hypothetical protein
MDQRSEAAVPTQVGVGDRAAMEGVVDARRLLFGRDDTPGIVSVSAGRDGRARVWRRISGTDGDPSRVVLEEASRGAFCRRLDSGAAAGRLGRSAPWRVLTPRAGRGRSQGAACTAISF